METVYATCMEQILPRKLSQIYTIIASLNVYGYTIQVLSQKNLMWGDHFQNQHKACTLLVSNIFGYLLDWNMVLAIVNHFLYIYGTHDIAKVYVAICKWF